MEKMASDPKYYAEKMHSIEGALRMSDEIKMCIRDRVHPELQPFLMHLPLPIYQDFYIPVSYTHLDVYKRQLQCYSIMSIYIINTILKCYHCISLAASWSVYGS